MRRNCNLELALLTPSSASDSHHHYHHSMEEASGSPQEQQQNHHQHHRQQPLTIFYNGKMCVCDVTETQAKTILMVASKEMEERIRTPSGSGSGSGSSEPSSPILLQSPSPSPHQQLYGLSMKRSLQRFLQKRKNRIQETSPYHH
ncbi:Protein TIFY 5A [Quillaja saponaria]|uniref:Protein TIFY n=1 Tax=Quillaja saponaria TaxID=32244 RepID=A0AAD7M367_QUISA|nr:Protein TIFY 5A [Quillaja saponaria]